MTPKRIEAFTMQSNSTSKRRPPRPKIAAVCEQCGNPFSHVPSKTRTFCCYECSRLARVRPLAERFWEKVQKSDGCWLWSGATNPAGYGNIGSGGHNGRPLLASRVSWEI